MRKGDRVRLERWGHCYLFVQAVCPSHIHGIVYQPAKGDEPLARRASGSWPLDAGWIPWHPSEPAVQEKEKEGTA